MSWLARSIANTLNLEDEDDDDEEPRTRIGLASEDQTRGVNPGAEDPGLTDSDVDERRSYDRDGEGDLVGEDGYNQGRGVKEDLSELKETLTRQFWGVASFLAPPPPPPPPPPLRQKSGIFRCESNSDWARSNTSCDEEEDEKGDESVEYVHRDAGQFGQVSNVLQLEEYSENLVEDAVGITEEVLAFARNIAHHPETWLDFPLSEEDELDDFDITNAQYKHALAVEQLAPRLAALRFEFCPAHMSEGYFWTVYFVLLHSRLNKQNADLLSSPQIVQARAMWMQELQQKNKDESYFFGSSSHLIESADLISEKLPISYEDTRTRYMLDRMSPCDPSTPPKIGSCDPFTLPRISDNEMEKHPLGEIEYIDKSVIKEEQTPELVEKEMIIGSSTETPTQPYDYDDEDDDWLKEDSDLIGYSSSMIIGNEDDVSFSDLEDDFDCTMPLKSKTAFNERSSTANTF